MRELNKVSVIGLGKVGVPLVAAMALRGFEVIGVDVDLKKVKSINLGQSPVFEPGLEQFLKRYKRKIRATSDYRQAVNDSELTFIIVPTPSKRDGSFSNKYVLMAMKQIGSVLREKKTPHIIAVMSTVSPGSMDKKIGPTLEKTVGKRKGKEIGLAYNPGFIALGSVIEGFLSPDLVLIGESDKKTGKILESFYRRFCKKKAPIARMNFINSEITKLALNTFITTKISFANMLTQLCGEVKGADVDVVTRAVGLDTRVGQKYLKGAVAYGGPCFPRDNRALRAFGRKAGVKLPLALATDRVNRGQTKAIVKIITKELPKGSKVAILGLAYKPKTEVAEESQGVKLAERLVERGYKVVVHDPQAIESAKSYLGKKVKYVKRLNQLKRGGGLVVATAWEDYIDKLPTVLKKKKISFKIIIDCWRIINKKALPGEVRYICLGRSLNAKEKEK